MNQMTEGRQGVNLAYPRVRVKEEAAVRDGWGCCARAIQLPRRGYDLPEHEAEEER